jgi:FKBP-type peptidyl-prolyl cis-trans isomerase FkpA
MTLFNDIKRIKILFIIVLVAACHENGKYSDFETDESGLRYKFLELGQSKEILSPGDYIEMELKYANEKDSILFNSKELRAPFRMQVRKASHGGGSFEDAVFLSHPGDRILFVLPADSFYIKTLRQHLPKGVKRNSNILCELKILRKLSSDEILEARDKYLKQMQEQEEMSIENYLVENKIKADTTSSGLYIIKKKSGNGQIARKGNFLTVHYVGKFIDGRVFDSSYKRNEPFEFELGAKQVIDAWDEACLKMRVGDKFLLITPSKLAYGKDGYGEIIPPFSPLIFEIELLAIN